jgi:hypothetical protein
MRYVMEIGHITKVGLGRAPNIISLELKLIDKIKEKYNA